MKARADVSFLRHWIDEFWNKGNLAYADEVVSSSYVLHDPTAPGLPTGPEALKTAAGIYRGASPDFTMTLEDAVVNGDRIAWRWSARGTATGSFMGIPPSGRPWAITGQVMSRFADGHWQEDWVNFDLFGLLQQIGAIPTAQPATA